MTLPSRRAAARKAPARRPPAEAAGRRRGRSGPGAAVVVGAGKRSPHLHHGARHRRGPPARRTWVAGRRLRRPRQRDGRRPNPPPAPRRPAGARARPAAQRPPLGGAAAPPQDEADVSAADTEPPSRRLALGYTCVPTGANAELDGDADRIRAWCAEADLSLARVVHDIEAHSEERGSRPALRWALDQIATGKANTLVVARLRNLSPNVAGLPRLLHWFTEAERRLVAIDLRLDTATDAGRLTAFALAGVGSWENERLSARTRRGLEAARSRGAGRAGAAVADLPELRGASSACGTTA